MAFPSGHVLRDQARTGARAVNCWPTTRDGSCRKNLTSLPGRLDHADGAGSGGAAAADGNSGDPGIHYRHPVAHLARKCAARSGSGVLAGSPGGQPRPGPGGRWPAGLATGRAGHARLGRADGRSDQHGCPRRRSGTLGASLLPAMTARGRLASGENGCRYGFPRRAARRSRITVPGWTSGCYGRRISLLLRRRRAPGSVRLRADRVFAPACLATTSTGRCPGSAR
jgi:hypothetical protein